MDSAAGRDSDVCEQHESPSPKKEIKQPPAKEWGHYLAVCIYWTVPAEESLLVSTVSIMLQNNKADFESSFQSA